MLPFFEGCGPYLTWMDDTSPEAEQAYYEGKKDSEMTKLVEQVRGMGDVVGVVGFSMGGKVGMEVVRRLEGEREREGEGEGEGVKIVVAVCGTVPFQGGSAAAGVVGKGGGTEEAREKGYRESLEKGVVKAVSVHLIGEGDPWRAESEKLVAFFDQEKRTVIRFRGEHHMPADDALNRQVVRMITAACGRG